MAYKLNKSKATDIPKKVKDKVWERDNHRCIICGSACAMPNSHYIRRSKGGLGIEENIVTMCFKCHFEYDNSTKGEHLKLIVEDYLKSKYPDWDKQKLIWRK